MCIKKNIKLHLPNAIYKNEHFPFYRASGKDSDTGVDLVDLSSADGCYAR